MEHHHLNPTKHQRKPPVHKSTLVKRNAELVNAVSCLGVVNESLYRSNACLREEINSLHAKYQKNKTFTDEYTAGAIASLSCSVLRVNGKITDEMQGWFLKDVPPSIATDFHL